MFNSNPKSIVINSWWWFYHRWWSDNKRTSKIKRFLFFLCLNLISINFWWYIFFPFYGGFIVSSDKMKESYWFFSLQWLVLSYTNVGCFYLKKEYCLTLFIWQLLSTKPFLSIYIKVGLASYILAKARKPTKPIYFTATCLSVLINCS